MEKDKPVPKLPPAQDDPLFLHKPLDGQGEGDGVTDVKVTTDSRTNILGSCTRFTGFVVFDVRCRLAVL